MATPHWRGVKVESKTESALLAERLLDDAREFVAGGWCQYAAALDERGRPIEPTSAFARSWSVLGALHRACARSLEPAEEARAAFEQAKLALTAAVNEVPQAWNDDPARERDQVLIALADARQLLGAPADSGRLASQSLVRADS